MTDQPQPPQGPKRNFFLRHKILSAVLALLLLFVVIGIASGGSKSATTASTTTTAAAPTTTSFPADETAALNALHPGCLEDSPKLDAEAKKALEIMQRNGVKDETTLTVLQHLRQSIPPGTPDMNCANQLGAYVTLRGNGG